MDQNNLDTQAPLLYNEAQACEIAEQAAAKAVQHVMQSLALPQAAILDTRIRLSDELSQKGDDSMSTRIRQRVQLPNGETVWCTGSTLAVAISNLLSRCMTAMPPEPDLQPSPMFQEYADHWFQTYHAPKVRPNTANNTKTLLKLHIYPYIADKELFRVTHDDVQKIFTAMSGKARSTANKVKIVLNEIFSNAKEDGYVRSNIVNSDRYVLPTAKTKRKAVDRQTLKDIIAQLPKLRKQDRLLIALAIYTGMRRGEILALQWEDIDFERKLIHVKRSTVFEHNRPVLKGTKSSAGVRDIPLDAELTTILNESSERNGFIIRNRLEPGIPITETEFKRMFNRIQKTINLHGATLHVFRHTYATLRKPQCDIKTLQTIMGHSDIKVTMDTYVDAIDEDIQKLSHVTLFSDTPVTQKSPETIEK